MKLLWNEISSIRGMVLCGAKTSEILDVFGFESEEKSRDILKVIDEMKKEMSYGENQNRKAGTLD